jgi:hypothetical protein
MPPPIDPEEDPNEAPAPSYPMLPGQEDNPAFEEQTDAGGKAFSGDADEADAWTRAFETGEPTPKPGESVVEFEIEATGEEYDPTTGE